MQDHFLFSSPTGNRENNALKRVTNFDYFDEEILRKRLATIILRIQEGSTNVRLNKRKCDGKICYPCELSFKTLDSNMKKWMVEVSLFDINNVLKLLVIVYDVSDISLQSTIIKTVVCLSIYLSIYILIKL